MDNFILKKNIQKVENKLNFKPLFGDCDKRPTKEIINIIFINDNWILGGGSFVKEALMEIRKIYSNTRLVIVGTKPDNEIENCIIIDDYNAVEYERYMNENSIFCVPYITESLGMPIITAMRYGLPVITTKNSFTERYIVDNDNGVFVDTGNKIQLIAMLFKLISDKNFRRKIGNNAYKKVIPNFHISNYTESFSIY